MFSRIIIGLMVKGERGKWGLGAFSGSALTLAEEEGKPGFWICPNVEGMESVGFQLGD